MSTCKGLLFCSAALQIRFFFSAIKHLSQYCCCVYAYSPVVSLRLPHMLLFGFAVPTSIQPPPLITYNNIFTHQ